MSKVPSNHPQQPGKSPVASLERSAPNKVSRPGWIEIIVGLVVFAIVGFGVGSQLKRLGFDPVVSGLVFTSLSGIASLESPDLQRVCCCGFVPWAATAFLLEGVKRLELAVAQVEMPPKN